ncbi:hypothetical protein FNF28_03325 [Cafeteria roenbergensis]|uniref:Uncharacterized protein n=1 Tax=Cafeteria roenbergensis TaxID=33653 RepID=A0A5A8DK84_CAFRO|nr:hypothetical protein FNF28_03325 [Cafeteria roenbergensis]
MVVSVSRRLEAPADWPEADAGSGPGPGPGTVARFEPCAEDEDPDDGPGPAPACLASRSVPLDPPAAARLAAELPPAASASAAKPTLASVTSADASGDTWSPMAWREGGESGPWNASCAAAARCSYPEDMRRDPRCRPWLPGSLDGPSAAGEVLPEALAPRLTPDPCPAEASSGCLREPSARDEAALVPPAPTDASKSPHAARARTNMGRAAANAERRCKKRRS